MFQMDFDFYDLPSSNNEPTIRAAAEATIRAAAEATTTGAAAATTSLVTGSYLFFAILFCSYWHSLQETHTETSVQLQFK
jgi:hypothetical protein